MIVGSSPRDRMGAASALTVDLITPTEHAAAVAGLVAAGRPVSFLQVPAWAEVKPGWDAESLAWRAADGSVVGTALVLYRKLPVLGRSWAYVPEGPVIDWTGSELRAWLTPLVAHLRRRRAFAVRIGPPVARRWWEARTVAAGLVDGDVDRLGDLASDGFDVAAGDAQAQLHDLGWVPAPGNVLARGPDRPTGGFAAGQPQYVFEVPTQGRSREDLLAGLGRAWRRNLRVAQRHGVEVRPGDVEGLEVFHALYRETAEREGFVPRPLSYFRGLWAAFADAPPGVGVRLYLAHPPGCEPQAAALAIWVGRHYWYVYGGSVTAGRSTKPSNAVQWRMMCDACDLGADVYDLRGIGDALDPDGPLAGLTRFKIGSGGRAVEYLGEWDLPLNRPLYRAFVTHLARRAAAP